MGFSRNVFAFLFSLISSANLKILISLICIFLFCLQVMEMISTTFLLLGLALCLHVAECTPKTIPPDNIVFSALNCRKHSAVLTDFGGVGDGITSNTKAFASAINKLSGLASDGGAMLIVPPGKWLTGSFNLTSHFTLYIHKDAVLLGSQV